MALNVFSELFSTPCNFHEFEALYEEFHHEAFFVDHYVCMQINGRLYVMDPDQRTYVVAPVYAMMFQAKRQHQQHAAAIN